MIALLLLLCECVHPSTDVSVFIWLTLRRFRVRQSLEILGYSPWHHGIACICTQNILLQKRVVIYYFPLDGPYSCNLEIFRIFEWFRLLNSCHSSNSKIFEKKISWIYESEYTRKARFFEHSNSKKSYFAHTERKAITLEKSPRDSCSYWSRVHKCSPECRGQRFEKEDLSLFPEAPQ